MATSLVQSRLPKRSARRFSLQGLKSALELELESVLEPVIKLEA
jgi:hypothetical protein